MDGDRHQAQNPTDVLIRKVDSHLTAVRAGLRGADLAVAERVAAVLRELVLDTAHACAADRARVRAAVHFFVLRREGRAPFPPVRSLAAARQMVDKVALRLGRPDLTVSDPRPSDPMVSADVAPFRNGPRKGNLSDESAQTPHAMGIPASRRPG